MKRLLKWLGIGIVGLVAVSILVVASGYLLPADVVLDLEQSVEAPPEAVFELFTTYDGVVRWWQQAAMDMGEDLRVTHLGGPEEGVGMEVGFGVTGGPVFERWTYTSMESPRRVEVNVDFQIFVSQRVFELTPEGAGTNVRWREAARVDSPILRWMMKLGHDTNVENRHTALIAAGIAAGQ